MRIHIRLKLVVAGALLAGLLGAASANADSPWWHLSSGARPTVLQPGVAKNEVQELTVSATEGDVVLAEPAPLNEAVKELLNGELTEEQLVEDVPHAVVPYNASVQQVQEGFEKVYPGREVIVTEGPSKEENSRTYVITFPGQVTSPNIIIRETVLVAVLGGEPLSCGNPVVVPCKEEASLTQVSEGRPDGQIVVTASNLGDASVNGRAPHQVKFVDKLPPGLKAVSIEGVAQARTAETDENRGPLDCSLKSPSLTCTFRKTLPPYHPIEFLIGVEAGVSSGGPNEASVSNGEGYVCDAVAAESGKFKDGFCTQEVTEGGNFERVSTGPVASASVRRRVGVGGEPAGFGVEDYELSNEDEGGALDTQAGSHPFQQTTTITLNQSLEQTAGQLLPQPTVLAKDLNFKWPAGLIGNPTPFPRCSVGQFLQTFQEHGGVFVSACPSQTAVGVARTLVNLPAPAGEGGTRFEAVVPLFNLEPSVGEPARLGFRVDQTPVFIDPSVRSGGDYGITVSVDNIAQTVGFVSSQVTAWGVPGDPSHDNARGYGCLNQALGITTEVGPCNPLEEQHPPPFLSMPTSCPRNPLTGEPEPLHTSIEADSWEDPKPAGQQLSFVGEPMESLDGCNALPFSPEIKVEPDGQQASTPTGLAVDVKVPQEVNDNGGGLASSGVKDISVTFPEGVTVNPASADGLEACSEGLVGFKAFGEVETEPGVSNTLFTPRVPGGTAAIAAGETEPLEPGVNFCPNASKIGTVKIKVPVIKKPLEGALYLAAQDANPFGSLLATYIVAEDPESGVVVKLPGEVSLNPVTGQITSTFKNSPQAPLEEAEIHLFGGAQAPFSTPPHCGTYTTDASFTPWSSTAPVNSTSSFEITSGPNGGPCPGASLPFAPSLHASSSNIQAGAFTPFTTTMTREDGQQNLQGIVLHMPPGLSGLLTGVKLCGEAEGNAGTCGPESEIGETTVSVGLGADPFTVTGGKVYITGPYRGAPFGLSIVNPAKAGPYDLGQVIVRAKIEVDPHTAALTITTDNTGPYKIPTILDGIPLEIKHVNVTINRGGGQGDFTFNPTNCNPMAITGSLQSVEGASSALSVPFQVTNCATLKFAPKFAVSTSGKTSKAKGASLSVHLTYPKAPFGSQANIARVKVDLPKQLPSRLTTLQKACTAKQFEANPAGCPSASIIGHAKAITPLIPVPLEGPAYFVSHGGEAFPSLIMVLQGYGVTVDLVGTTFISKAGITSSTFKTVPDAPVGSFELMLPEGKFSALAANGNLCKSQSKLKMPTEFVAQNGSKINESTKISVTGCAKSKKAKHARKAGKGKQGKHGKKVRHERGKSLGSKR